LTVAFRKVSAARELNQKKGEWNIGPATAAAEKILAWIDQMISLKTGNNVYEIEKI
jgi:hypothetical protein